MFIFAAEVIFDTLKPLGRKVWEGFFNTIKSIQQQISFDINGNPVWGLGLGISANPSTTLDEIFNYLNSAGKPCMVAIDEFQRITDYPDGQNVEAFLSVGHNDGIKSYFEGEIHNICPTAV